MPLDKPVYKNEQILPLASYTLTSSGCTSAGLAVDDDPSTVAVFGPPVSTAIVVPPPVTTIPSGHPFSAKFQVVAGTANYQRRFIRVDFDTDCPVSRIRLGLSGAGGGNAGVALVPSLAAYESPVPVPYPEADVIYGPVLPPLTGQVKDVVFDPPFLAKGVIFYPDFLDTPPGGQPASYPAVMLNQLQVYEQYSKGVNIIMPLPTVQWTQVGIQALALFPWNGAAGPYDATTRCNLYGLQSADLGITQDTVEGKGGESIFDIFSAEVGREYEIKFAAFKIDVRTLAILQGGRLGVDPATGAGGEVQAHSPNFTDRAPDLRLFLQTTVGDGQVTIVLPRCKGKGAINWSMKAKEIIIPEFTVKAKWDPTYIAQDGGVGGICDFLYGDKGTLARHS